MFSSISCHHIVVLLIAFGLPTAILSVNEKVCELKKTIIFCNCDMLSGNDFEAVCYVVKSDVTPDHPVWNLFKESSLRLTELKISAFSNNTLNFYPKKVVDHLGDTLAILKLSDLNMTVLETASFNNLAALRTLEISVCPHLTIKENAFFSLPNLEKVNFNNVMLTELDDMFEDVPKLKELCLDGNNISIIKKNSFSALKNLEFLTLESNRIDDIERKTFIGLEKLKVFDISKNRLTYLPPYVFSEMKNLVELDLSDNQISLIDVNAFQDLFELERINLSKNKLTFLDADVFSTNKLLEIVEINSNLFQHLSRQVFFQKTERKYFRIRISSK